LSNNDPYWRDWAACANHDDPELFFPGTGEVPRDAIRICGECPVRRPCLTYALNLGATEGVWGGTTANQRRAMLTGKHSTRLAAKIDRRRQRAAALRAAGWELERIAKYLGVGVATVGSDLRCVQQQAAS